jgi:hypothetical protein
MEENIARYTTLGRRYLPMPTIRPIRSRLTNLEYLVYWIIKYITIIPMNIGQQSLNRWTLRNACGRYKEYKKAVISADFYPNKSLTIKNNRNTIELSIRI